MTKLATIPCYHFPLYAPSNMKDDFSLLLIITPISDLFLSFHILLHLTRMRISPTELVICLFDLVVHQCCISKVSVSFVLVAISGLYDTVSTLILTI